MGPGSKLTGASGNQPPGAGARPPRQRNPIGQGGRLRDEIIIAATTLLERTGSEEAVSMRAVAREVGVAPPSMSRHFADRAQLIDAVVARELVGLHDTLAAAVASETDPVERLLAVARAYVGFGRDHASRYRVIFERRFLDLWGAESRVMEQTAPVGNETFELMVRIVQDCADAGRCASTDAFADAVAVWMGLHGLVALPQAITSFPWPDTDELIVSLVTRLNRIAGVDEPPLPRPPT